MKNDRAIWLYVIFVMVPILVGWRVFVTITQ